MYGELKTQYGNLHAVHERLQAEHEAIVRSASAPVGLDVSRVESTSWWPRAASVRTLGAGRALLLLLCGA